MVFLGGFGTSASAYGLPDLGLLGLGEMSAAVRRMAGRLSIPLVADADTGHGDLHHVQRSTAEFEAAGAAGMILEDQQFPKRCGHFEGKRVIPPAAMVLKLKAALRARGNPDFVLVARTDAREVHGLDDAIERVNRYAGAGADMVFVEAPLSAAELETIARRVAAPKLVNMLTFGKTPILAASELEDMGYKIVVAPIESLLVTVKAVRELAEVFRRDGHAGSLTQKMVTLDALKAVLGVEKFLSLREELE
jgi:methylisocitrate lyase